jgi:tRNA (guanine26-N2/guanine27-N2)-dimethyltransferase
LQYQDEFAEITEGSTRLLVPRQSLISKVPPRFPAFFNPAAKLSRDVSIIAYRAYALRLKERTFADPLAGVGSRGVRVAKEVPAIDQVFINDVNPEAMAAAAESAKLNFVASKCVFSIKEGCSFLLGGNNEGERFGIVDLDPFGTPARHIDCVLRAVLDGGLISITATDTAVLAGVYPEVCMRRYYGRPLRTSYSNEVALRLVLSLTALTASRLDLGIKPIFCHSSQHYLRVYASLVVSNTAANQMIGNIGYIKHCFTCGYRSKTEDGSSGVCPLCGKGLTIGGPLWTGPIYDNEFVMSMLSDQQLNPQCSKLITTASEELVQIPFYFKVDEISKHLRTNPFSVSRLIEVLALNGYKASPSALNPSGIKTDAQLNEILGILR